MSYRTTWGDAVATPVAFNPIVRGSGVVDSIDVSK